MKTNITQRERTGEMGLQGLPSPDHGRASDYRTSLRYAAIGKIQGAFLSFLQQGKVSKPSSSHRMDIDGLRAIAALAVLLFHFFPKALPGGYVGVDIFFVISGYVVTRSIILEIETHQFSLMLFYMKRIRRLYPPLLAVSSFCLLVAWATQLGADFTELGKEVLLALSYVINFYLADGPGYFDTASSESPLLHVWSLAVEEQFYLLWPVVLLFAFRAGKQRIVAWSILLGSFLTHVVVGGSFPQIAFYMLPTRAWEFMAGALIALPIASSWLQGGVLSRGAATPLLLSVAGMISLSVACALYAPDDSYTAWMAAMPVLGTVAIICSPLSPFNQGVLSSRILVWFGQRSYSLYLWHWPALVFYRENFGGGSVILAPVGLFAFTVIAAHLTYVGLEVPTRNLSVAAPRRVASRLVAAQGFLMIAALLVWQGAVPERLTNLRPFSDAKHDWVDIDKVVFLDGRKEGKVLFFGDSYIEQLYPRIPKASAALLGRHKDIVFFTQPGCTPMPKVNRRTTESCLSFVEEGFRMARGADVTNVVIGGSWVGFLRRGDYYVAREGEEVPVDPNTPQGDFVFDAFEAELKSLIQAGKTVHLILTPPGDPRADPSHLATAQSKSDSYMTLPEHRERAGKINERLVGIAHRAGATVLDPVDWLCTDRSCSFIDGNGEPIFKDATHLRARFVREQLRVIDSLIQ